MNFNRYIIIISIISLIGFVVSCKEKNDMKVTTPLSLISPTNTKISEVPEITSTPVLTFTPNKTVTTKITLISKPTCRPPTDPFYDRKISNVIYQYNIWEKELGMEKAFEKTLKWLYGELDNPPRPEGIINASIINDTDGGNIWVEFSNGSKIRKISLRLKPPDGRTYLHVAVEMNDKEYVQSLIDKGADVNAKDKFGYTPLFFAATYEVAELLISHGADINARNYYDLTPLHMSVICNNKRLIELFIARGADINVKNKSGLTPLDCAGNNAIREFVKKCIIEKQNK
ncbi:MAG: ankyrin repeat domain-containing protein [Candidatus Eremiobacterota bacterium]